MNKKEQVTVAIMAQIAQGHSRVYGQQRKNCYGPPKRDKAKPFHRPEGLPVDHFSLWARDFTPAKPVSHVTRLVVLPCPRTQQFALSSWLRCRERRPGKPRLISPGRVGRPDVQEGLVRVRWRNLPSAIESTIGRYKSEAAYTGVIKSTLARKARAFPKSSIKRMKVSYRRYLDSAHWRNLKAQKFDEVGKHCQSCDSTFKVRVHHVHYRQLTDCTPSDLVVLCEQCHDDLHNALQCQGLRSSDAAELYQIKHLIHWVRTSSEVDRDVARRVAKRRLRLENKDRRLRAPARIMGIELKRILRQGRGSVEAIDKAIAYLQDYRNKIAA